MSFWERLRKYISDGPQSVERPFALLPKKELETAVRLAVGGRLVGLGFQRIAKGRWVREEAPGIRGLVQLEQLKAECTAVWGVSLDFVPHLGEDFHLQWHREPRTARLDLSYDPLNHERDSTIWTVSQFSTMEELPRDAERFASRVADAVVNFLEPLRTIDGLLKAFEAKRARQYISLAFEHQPQEVLAYAFVLAKAGKPVEASAALQAYARSLQQFVDSQGNPRQVQANVMAKLGELLARSAG